MQTAQVVKVVKENHKGEITTEYEVRYAVNPRCYKHKSVKSLKAGIKLAQTLGYYPVLLEERYRYGSTGRIIHAEGPKAIKRR